MNLSHTETHSEYDYYSCTTTTDYHIWLLTHQSTCPGCAKYTSTWHKYTSKPYTYYLGLAQAQA